MLFRKSVGFSVLGRAVDVYTTDNLKKTDLSLDGFFYGLIKKDGFRC